MSKLSNLRGFSLVEVLIPIVIFILMAAIAIPTSLRWRARNSPDNLEDFFEKMTAAKREIHIYYHFYEEPFKGEVVNVREDFVEVKSDNRTRIVPYNAIRFVDVMDVEE
jgi:type II secretory pathway pseudopilin PulG